MIKAECDRCKKLAETNGVTTTASFGVLKTTEPRLPQTWHRVRVPDTDEMIEPRVWDLCPVCLLELRSFLGQYEWSPPAEQKTEPMLAEILVSRYRRETRTTLTGIVEKLRCNDHEGWSVARGVLSGPPDVVAAEVDTWLRETIEKHEKEAHGATPFLKAVPSAPQLRECPVTPRADGEAAPACGGVTGTYAEHAEEHHPEHPACTECGEPTVWDVEDRRWRHLWDSFEHVASVILLSEEAHGARHDCPYCALAFKGILLGQHIAKAHPGEWQAWADEQSLKSRKP